MVAIKGAKGANRLIECRAGELALVLEMSKECKNLTALEIW